MSYKASKIIHIVNKIQYFGLRFCEYNYTYLRLENGVVYSLKWVVIEIAIPNLSLNV